MPPAAVLIVPGEDEERSEEAGVRCCCGKGLFSSRGVVITVITSELPSLSFARRSRSLASFCAIVTNVILTFFMSFVKPSIGSCSCRGGEASGEGAAEDVFPAAVVEVPGAFLGALTARGAGSFLAGARVFFTFRALSFPCTEFATLTLMDDSGRILREVSGRTELTFCGRDGTGTGGASG